MRLLSLLALCLATSAHAADRPNILWLTNEDMGPNLGCYGDRYAQTPNLDALAAKSLRYTRCWSNAPVCAPARTTIITGMYPTSTGSEHMRSIVPMPKAAQMFPSFLRQAGYYCTNNVKEDYNLEKPAGTWDESSNKAHYRNRKPGQPFFAVFNFTTTHESQIRTRPHTAISDPAKVSIPPYHPDLPEVRQDWAQYYDKIRDMDRQVGKALQELADARLQDDTIIVYFSDHGSGMPRHKRCAQNSGLHVPFIVHFPEKWKHLAPKDYQPGGQSDRLISFVDLAPSMLSLTEIDIPVWMQGVAFLGKSAAAPREYVHGFRGRMDERIDMVRSLRDGRYVYVRNFLPHKPKGQHVAYMYQTPTTIVWKKAFDEGRLTPAQAAFFQRKAPEELYDLERDPAETENLAGSAAHADVLKRFRNALSEHMVRVRDVGLLPEAEMHRRAGAGSPYDFARSEAYPVLPILETALAASRDDDESLALLKKRWNDAEPGIRYWAVMGMRIRGAMIVQKEADALQKALSDANLSVRCAAAEALLEHPDHAVRAKAAEVLFDLADAIQNGAFVPVAALNALEPWKTEPGFRDTIAKLPEKTPGEAARNNEYVGRLKSYYLGRKLKD